MVLCGSYEALKEKIDGYRKRGAKSNFFFMPQKIQELIDKKKLFMSETGGNLFIYEKDDGFYRMYYFLGNVSDTARINPDMTVVIEFPFRGKYSANHETESEYIKRLGFDIVRNSAFMTVKSEDICLPAPKTDGRYRIDYAKKEDADCIKTLLDTTFDKYLSLLPNAEELLKLIEQNHIIALYDKSDVIGVLDVETNSRSCYICHVMVDSKYRGKNLSIALLRFMIEQYRDKVKEFTLWVDINNTPAVRLYEKAGYRFTSKRADEYILKI